MPDDSNKPGYKTPEPPSWLRDVFGPLADGSIDDDAPWPHEEEWVLIKQTIPSFDVWVQFAEPIPGASELIAVRKSVPEFQHARPAAIKARVRDDGRLYLGTLSDYAFRNIEGRCEDQGVQLYIEDASTTRYRIYNRSKDVLWNIKDETRYNAVIKEMLDAGVMVVDSSSSGEP